MRPVPGMARKVEQIAIRTVPNDCLPSSMPDQFYSVSQRREDETAAEAQRIQCGNDKRWIETNN